MHSNLLERTNLSQLISPKHVELCIDEIQDVAAEALTGYKSVSWDARQTADGLASGYASGVYFYRMEAIPQSGTNNPTKSFVQVRKMLLLR